MKYKYNGEWKDLNVKVSDTLPIGSIVDFDGETIPSGWEEVEDTGSNANGNWIKYENGVMICWDSIVVDDQAISDSYGALYLGTRIISFPVEFKETPSVSCSTFRYGTSASWGFVSTASKTAATLRALDVAPRATGTDCEIAWMAIGRWK